MIRLVFALAVLAAPAAGADFDLPATTGTPRIDFSSERLDYDKKNGTLELSGSVVVSESSRTVRSEKLILEMEAERASSPGPLSVERGSSTLTGSGGWFMMGGSTGELYDADGGSDPWSMRSKRMRFTEETRKMRSARITSCDVDPDHYHFWSSHATHHPGKSLHMWNVFFFLGRMPVFYFPYLYRNLRAGSGVRFFFSPAYDRRNGATLFTTIAYTPYPGIHTKAYIDMFGRRGIGHGGEVTYSLGGANGTMYGYRIKEQDGIGERWTVLASHLQELGLGEWLPGGGRYAVQVFMRSPSDPLFNQHYFRENSFIASPDRERTAAFLRQTDKTLTRVSYRRNDPVFLDGTFGRGTETFPRVDWQHAPMTFKYLPGVHNLSANYVQTNRGTAASVNQSGSASYSVSQSIPLAGPFSMVPSAGFNETFSKSYLDIWRYTGTYNVGDSLRYTHRKGTLDLGWSFSQRFKQDRWYLDRGADDYGIGGHALNGGITLRPHRRMYSRLTTSYDLRNSRTSRRTFQDRLTPVVGEVSLYPARMTSVFAAGSYRLGTGIEGLLVQADRGDPEGTFGGLGFTYNRTRTDPLTGGVTGESFLVHHTAGWKPRGASWRLEAAFRYRLLKQTLPGLRFREIASFDRSIILYKRFHDFDTRWEVRARGGATLFLWSLELAMPYRPKAEPEKERDRTQAEQEAYPWRQSSEGDVLR